MGAAARRYWDSTAATVDSRKAFVVFDRGVAMFEAVAVAMIALKRGDDDLGAARLAFTEIIERLGLIMPHENFAILLRHDSEDIDVCVERTMSRAYDSQDWRYMHYQRLLQTELLFQETRKVYQHTIRVSDSDGYGKVQDMLRGALFEETKNPLFLPMLHPLQAVYGFSGLSEAGKSSLAGEFCSILGTQHSFRAKIVYFNDLVSQRLGKSIYRLPDKEQAFHLFHELEIFARAHYWLRVITIESLHSYGVTQWLKLWLGDKFQVIFVQVDDAKRRSRSLVTQEEMNRNDRLKLERGVEVIAAEADLALDNNGTVEASLEALLDHARVKGVCEDWRAGKPAG